MLATQHRWAGRPTPSASLDDLAPGPGRRASSTRAPRSAASDCLPARSRRSGRRRACCALPSSSRQARSAARPGADAQYLRHPAGTPGAPGGRRGSAAPRPRAGNRGSTPAVRYTWPRTLLGRVLRTRRLAGAREQLEKAPPATTPTRFPTALRPPPAWVQLAWCARRSTSRQHRYVRCCSGRCRRRKPLGLRTLRPAPRASCWRACRPEAWRRPAHPPAALGALSQASGNTDVASGTSDASGERP